MEIVGYLASALIGLSLGLVGSGGSILTIPVMVYLFRVEPTLATAYSLFIVGVTALAGGLRSSLNHAVDFKAMLVFALPSLLSVYLTRRILIPLLPSQLVTIDGFILTRDIALMVFFALLMVVASLSMIVSARKQVFQETEINRNYPLIWVIGTVVGLVTGLVGAGGGFLIIPALVFFAGLSMKKAVGTSLLIIATNSLIGFLGDLGTGRLMDFPFLLLVAAIAVAGILVGGYLSQFIEGQKLKETFGWIVLVMGVYILFHEALQ